jgi:hypothetical protein
MDDNFVLKYGIEGKCASLRRGCTNTQRRNELKRLSNFRHIRCLLNAPVTAEWFGTAVGISNHSRQSIVMARPVSITSGFKMEMSRSSEMLLTIYIPVITQGTADSS